MQIKEGLEIKNYRDFQIHKIEIFNIISDTIDLVLEEAILKNPTFVIKDYDELVNINDI